MKSGLFFAVFTSVDAFISLEICSLQRASVKAKNRYYNRVDVGSYPQHLSLHRTYGSRIRRYIHIGERKF